MGRHLHLALREREDIMMMRRGRVGDCPRHRARQVHGVARAQAQLVRAVLLRVDRTAALRRAQGRCAAGGAYSAMRDCSSWSGKSPWTISGRLALELGKSPVSDTTVYRGINEGLFDGCIGGRKARRRLRHRGKRRRGPSEQRGKIRVSREIPERLAGARSSRTTPRSRPTSAWNSTSRCRIICGSAAPTRTPTASFGSAFRRANPWDASTRRRFKGCTISSTAGRANAWVSDAPYEIRCSKTLHLI